jgi:hypothetical protein
MNLYKANFTSIIHCEDELEAARIARELANDDTAFIYEEESIQDVSSKDDLPYGWETCFYPINDAEGSYDDNCIAELLRKNSTEISLHKRIEELEKELTNLKSEYNKNSSTVKNGKLL